uniref:Transmembrane protein n=1 Tax=viral metagenome TaxID=1070528 RepID=A0A6C0KT11_9ZZZZ
MEFFIPGLLLFLVAILVTAWLSPKATPMVAAILSIVFLIYGINDHYRLFASEYRLSTWQQSLMTFAPFIMIGAIILFIIYGIIGFFTSASVPVPNMPVIPNIMPNSGNNKGNGIVDSINRIGNNLFNNKGNNNKGIANSLGFGNNKKNNNGTSRSFLETI